MKVPLLQQFLNYESFRDSACEELQKALIKAWPEGSEIDVLLSGRQTTPTRCEVIAASGSDGRLVVRLFSQNRRGCRTVKRVHWSAVRTEPVRAKAKNPNPAKL